MFFFLQGSFSEKCRVLEGCMLTGLVLICLKHGQLVLCVSSISQNKAAQVNEITQIY